MRVRQVALVLAGWAVIGAASSCGDDGDPAPLEWTEAGGPGGAGGASVDASAGSSGANAGAAGAAAGSGSGGASGTGSAGSGGAAAGAGGTAGSSASAGTGGAMAGSGGEGPAGSAGVAGDAGEAGDSGLPSCPDGACNGAEDCDTCPADCGACSCEHSPCLTGSALDSACSPCVALVCNADTLCCDVHWDYQCATAALSQCQLACGCPHGPCIPGAPMVAGCSACVDKVCAAEPSCCSLGWDDACIVAVGSVCGSACPGR